MVPTSSFSGPTNKKHLFVCLSLILIFRYHPVDCKTHFTILYGTFCLFRPLAPPPFSCSQVFFLWTARSFNIPLAYKWSNLWKLFFPWGFPYLLSVTMNCLSTVCPFEPAKLPILISSTRIFFKC